MDETAELRLIARECRALADGIEVSAARHRLLDAATTFDRLANESVAGVAGADLAIAPPRVRQIK